MEKRGVEVFVVMLVCLLGGETISLESDYNQD